MGQRRKYPEPPAQDESFVPIMVALILAFLLLMAAMNQKVEQASTPAKPAHAIKWAPIEVTPAT